MNSSVSAGMAESTAERSTIFSQWSHRPRTAPRRGGPPAVENRTSLMRASALVESRIESERTGGPRSHLGSGGGRFPSFARRLGPLDVLGPAQDVGGIAGREALGRDPHALEVRFDHEREESLHLAPRREGALRRVPLVTVLRRYAVASER